MITSVKICIHWMLPNNNQVAKDKTADLITSVTRQQIITYVNFKKVP